MSFTVLKFSPSKLSSPGPPQRKVLPSPQRLSPKSTTVILPRQRADEAGSPVRKSKTGKGEQVLDARFEIQTSQSKQDLAKALTASKRIELSFSLVENGRPNLPPPGGLSELMNLFPTTFAADVLPPYVIIRVRTLPPKPWPFTVGGLPLWLTTDEYAECFDRGRHGRGQKALEHIDLQRKDEFLEHILKEAIAIFKALQVKIQDIMWCAGFWSVTIPDNTDLKVLPPIIAHQVCYYKFQSENSDPDPSALRSKVPQGIEYDDSLYASSDNAILRPGIMLSSSIRVEAKDGKTEEVFKTTTSGILVVDRHGHPFITVATHGFEEDGLIYHPNPIKGICIGKIVDRLSGTDISIAKLNSSLRYVNETFGTVDNPGGSQMSAISQCYPPHLRSYDSITMDSPFSGSCEGCVLGIGGKIQDVEGDHIPHHWYIFENWDEAVDGSCGSPILGSDGQVLGLFRFKKIGSRKCFAVCATELHKFGYEICSEEREF